MRRWLEACGWARSLVAFALVLAFVRFIPAYLCGRGGEGFWEGDVATQQALADELVAFEKRDDLHRKSTSHSRFAGEWALVTHQMIALGLAQIVLAHPELRERYAPAMTNAAVKSFLPEMRDFGTRGWGGEDPFDSLESSHGHAYMGYPALAVSMARVISSNVPREVVQQHDALIAAYERRLLASPTGLIETYPDEAFPTDVAAVAAAIAIHGRATGVSHQAVLQHWAERVRRVQIDSRSGFVVQRMSAASGEAHDHPRGSGTGLAAYFAGFVDRELARTLAEGLWSHRSTFLGFGGIDEYTPGRVGTGDVDSGPVVLGVSVAATGFALAPARAFHQREAFFSLYRTADLFGLPVGGQEHFRFATGGPIGNALLLAFLTSGPELAP